jgi:ubiquinone/menaquinone biosynthesis C-methylase UbiE
MARHRVCPWWLGYLLVTPLRRLVHDPSEILSPYVHEGMTVLEPGPGMGFFTVELARRVGGAGRVVAVDIQPKMLYRLKKRLAKAGLLERVDARQAGEESMGVSDLDGKIDFVLAFAVVHEVTAPHVFFNEAARAMKRGAALLLAEPVGHVTNQEFARQLAFASQAGLTAVERPAVWRNHAALAKKQ